jgi:hypothetical protein
VARCGSLALWHTEFGQFLMTHISCSLGHRERFPLTGNLALCSHNKLQGPLCPVTQFGLELRFIAIGLASPCVWSAVLLQ